MLVLFAAVAQRGKSAGGGGGWATPRRQIAAIRLQPRRCDVKANFTICSCRLSGVTLGIVFLHKVSTGCAMRRIGAGFAGGCGGGMRGVGAMVAMARSACLGVNACRGPDPSLRLDDRGRGCHFERSEESGRRVRELASLTSSFPRKRESRELAPNAGRCPTPTCAWVPAFAGTTRNKERAQPQTAG